MRRILFSSFTFILLVVALSGCGSSGNGGNGGGTRPPTPQVTTFAFLQDTPSQSGLLTPMLGTFTVTGTNVQFSSAVAATDASTGRPVSGSFTSIILSPDGKKGTFDLYGGMENTPSNQWDIWVASLSGSTANLLQITNDSYADFTPQFSPDGTKVVFASDYAIAVENADGTGMEQLLPMPPGVGGQLHPTYSPDGHKIAMRAWGTDPNTSADFDGIWVMNADGSNPVMLTNPLSSGCSCWDEMPAFSADGSKIFFSRYVAATSQTEFEDIFVMNIDGTNLTQLTNGAGVNMDPMLLTIGGLGQRILFSSNRSNPADSSKSTYDIYSMRTDGTEITRLTSNSVYDGFCYPWYETGSFTANAQHMQASQRLHRTPIYGPVRPNWH